MTTATPYALDALRERLRALSAEAAESFFWWTDFSIECGGLRSFDVAEILFADALRRGSHEWASRFLSSAVELAARDRNAAVNLQDALAVSRWIEESELFAAASPEHAADVATADESAADLLDLAGDESDSVDEEWVQEDGESGPSYTAADLAALMGLVEEHDVPGVTSRKVIGFRELGVLRKAGYRVGRDGVLDAHERRKVLARVLMEPFPDEWAHMLGADYLRSWGRHRTWVRAESVTMTIVRFRQLAIARQSNPRTGDQSMAIAHYTEDLAWLRDKLAPQNPPFRWPE